MKKFKVKIKVASIFILFITIYTIKSSSIVYATSIRVDSFTAKCHPKSEFLSEGEHCLDPDCTQKVLSEMYHGGQYRIGFLPFEEQYTISPTENDLHKLSFRVFLSSEKNPETFSQNALDILQNFCSEDIGSVSDTLYQHIQEWVTDSNRCGDLNIEPYSREKENKLFDENQTSPYCYYKYQKIGNWLISSYLVKNKTPTQDSNFYAFLYRVLILLITVLTLLSLIYILYRCFYKTNKHN